MGVWHSNNKIGKEFHFVFSSATEGLKEMLTLQYKELDKRLVTFQVCFSLPSSGIIFSMQEHMLVFVYFYGLSWFKS